MARNEEKQLARLNRFYLQKDKEEYLKKHPRRPRLDSLSKASDIQKWLPSIKTDLDYYIKQSMVPCYPESVIEDFSRKISILKHEYRAFVTKLRQLDPQCTVTPWTDRPYAGCKRPATQPTSENEEDSASPGKGKSKIGFQPLSTPLLDTDSKYRRMYGCEESPAICYNVNEEVQDKPLVFRPPEPPTSEFQEYTADGPNCDSALQHFPDGRLLHSDTRDGRLVLRKSLENVPENDCINDGETICRGDSSRSTQEQSDSVGSSRTNSVTAASSVNAGLNLPYSDSEDSSGDSNG